MLIRRRRTTGAVITDPGPQELDQDRGMLILQYGIALVAVFCAALLSSLH